MLGNTLDGHVHLHKNNGPHEWYSNERIVTRLKYETPEGFDPGYTTRCMSQTDCPMRILFSGPFQKITQMLS